MTTELASPPIQQELNMLQLNCNRSSKVMHSLFNDPSTDLFDILFLQEPYTYPRSGLPLSNPNWTQHLPSTPPSLLNSEGGSSPDARYRSVICVNKRILSHHQASIQSNSPLLSGVEIISNTLDSPITLLNAYLPPGSTDLRPILDFALSHASPGPLILAMDSNLHNSLWNPPAYSHTHPTSSLLLEIAAENQLLLRSEPGIPTFIPNSTRKTKTTIDLQWMNDQADDLTLSCVTDTSLAFSHTSDHAAIKTTLLLPSPATPPPTLPPRFDWRKADRDALGEALEAALLPLVDQFRNHTSLQDLDDQVSRLTSTIQEVIDNLVPKSKPNPSARRWWCKETLDPLKKSSNRLRRQFNRLNTEESRRKYVEAAKLYHAAIIKAKTDHWREYLSSLTDANLFSAVKFTNGPPEAKILPPLRAPDGHLTTSPSEQADLLFAGTSAPTVPCNLSDVVASPPRPPSSRPISLEEIQLVISALKDFKAPGRDTIINLAIKLGGIPMASCLLNLANAILQSGLFPSSWKVAKSAILKKAGKPDYSNPAAYRPIALLSTLGKVIEAVLANRIRSFAETNNLLPPGHYGGRQKHSTTDALLHLTAWTKNKWREKKVVGVLFVDVQAAFPTVNPTRLCNTLEKMGFCPLITRLLFNYLSNRKTTINFGSFESEPKDLSIGLPQGSPLSVILYILYNSSLLEQIQDMQDTISLGFIDDVAFATAHTNLDKMVDNLQILARRELRWGSKHGAAFDKKKSQWLLFTKRRLKGLPTPTIKLGDEILEPQSHIKWLGVTLDPKLSFNLHGRAAEKKGTAVLLRLSSISKKGWGIPVDQFLKLTTSLVHSRTDYACQIWHSFGSNSSTTKALQRVDNFAQRLALGALRSHPLIFLKHDTAMPSAINRLNAKADAGAARFLSLPSSNPAGVLARHAASNHVSKHQYPVISTLHSPLSVCGSLKSPIEILDPTESASPSPGFVKTSIAPDKDTATRRMIMHDLIPPPNSLTIYSDGSLIPKQGVGSAAIHVVTDTFLQARLGSDSEHTVYEAELVGLALAAKLARILAPPTTVDIFFLIDNQACIRAMARPLLASPGQHLRQFLLDELFKLNHRLPAATVHLYWCPGHCGIEGNEAVDILAKEAVESDLPSLKLPTSLSSVKQQIRSRLKLSVTNPPPRAILHRLRGLHNPRETLKVLASLPRGLSTAIAQLRANHAPLNAYLFWRKAADSPNCEVCNCPETPEHFLLICRKYIRPRTRLKNDAAKLKIEFNVKNLLSNPEAIPLTAAYIKETWRFTYLRRLPRPHDQFLQDSPSPPPA